MTYNTGSNILANDYNTFATLTGGINEVYTDMHPGATTVAAGADYGYGQSSTLVSVAPGANIHASEWSALFTVMKNCGTHQGTTTVPPLPLVNPAVGNTITAFNSPTTLTALLSTLRTNRFALAAGQSAFTTATSSGTSSPWTNTLTYTFSVNLGTWDNARYFFNSGGVISLNGSYPGSGFPVTSDDYQWYSMLAAMSPLVFASKSTTPNSGVGGTSIGFWNNTTGNPLTTSYTTVYSKLYGGGGYYTNSTIVVDAKLAAAAPAAGSGTIQFRVTLTQADTSVPSNPKTLATTFTMAETHSAGTFAWPGSATITPGSFSLT
jgi:hypothetical protein